MNAAQGSITIKRLRTGDSLYLSFDLNGIDLFQGVNPESGAVVPDWTQAANQPVITPRVQSVRGYNVVLSQHTWLYGGLNIAFTVDNGDGWFADAAGRFHLNMTTGALKIVKNLASLDNVGNDVLTYKCVASVMGVEYALNKDIDVRIQAVGSSSYIGSLLASPSNQLSAAQPTTILKSSLLLGMEKITEYHTKWFKDSEAWASKNGQKEVTVTRDDVHGAQLFICEFYKSESDGTPVCRMGIRVLDISDEYQLNFRFADANREVDTNKPVNLEAYILNATTMEQFTPSGAEWQLSIHDKDSWEVLKTSSTNKIQVTTAETDRDGKYKDVEVTGEVQF